jgi:hypothetical protein
VKPQAADFSSHALEFNNPMVAQSIDQLKQDWTDKYVVVDGQRPELARFRDVVGRVKTVNMSGRALVEFLDYHVNIGWYDIDLDFLKIVDKPPPKAEKPKAEKKPAAKPAGEAASAAGAKPKPAAKPTAGGKPSVADILAAARAGKSPTKTEAAGEAAPAPAKAKPAGKPAAVDRSKMSVADMLAAARAGGAAGATKAPAEAAPVQEEAAEPEAAPVAAKPNAAPAAKSTEKIDKSKMSIDDMLAWCRAHDAK